MDHHSEHTGDPEQEDGDVASAASRLSGIKASPGPQTPAETAEPEPEPQPEAVEASEGGVAAAEPADSAEPQEGPAALEAAGEEEPGEQDWPTEAEPEPEVVAEAGPEEPAKPEPKEELEEAEEEEEEEEEEAEEGTRKEAPSQGSLPLSTIGQEQAAPVPEAESEEQEEEEEGKSEGESVCGSLAKSELEQKGAEEALEEEGLEWTEEVQKLQEQQLRSELLKQYRALIEERSCYQRYNVYLQHQIFEALRKKKGLDIAEVSDRGTEPEPPEKEQAYLSYLAVLEELKRQQADDLDWYHQELDHLKQQCKEKVSKVQKEWRSFQALKKQVMMQAMGSFWVKGGRQAAVREVEETQALEEEKEKEVSAVRLENLQLKKGLMHFEMRMRAQEDTGEGLLLIDFEQLKIENQTFNEKVEERNEELLKLRNKVNNNVHIITHVREKAHFVEIQNAGKKAQLSAAEAHVALRRELLAKTKQARDCLRADNVRVTQKCGLLGKESLLRDMEEKVARTEQLTQRVESLKRQHTGLALSHRGVRQKIREAKAFLPP